MVNVADFGLSAFLPESPEERLTEFAGTPSYIAPEIFGNCGYREEVDVFSLGSILFNLLTGSYMFNGRAKEEIMMNN